MELSRFLHGALQLQGSEVVLIACCIAVIQRKVKQNGKLIEM